jgi:glycosyltransferase involved in cell wall biosynthesis
MLAISSSSPPSRTDGAADALLVILVSPNVSEQMGGEAIKALQIYLELDRQGTQVHQITHERVREELTAKFPAMRVTYLKDDGLQKALWASKAGRPFVRLVFQKRAARAADAIAAKELAAGRENIIIHYSAPVSPVLPGFGSRLGVPVVIGPLNGNIFYPPGFTKRESMGDRIRRVFHPALQFGHRLLFSGKQSADALLVAGGERTYQSLRMAGCRDEQFVDSIDSGIPERLLDQPRIRHSGRNLNFMQNGRLVDHKAADLVIRAMTKTRNPVTFHVIGRGPLRERCIKLAAELNLGDRVRFTEWVKDHEKVADILRENRAFVFPSLAEANGIVVQEAMMMGLPVICLDWGGPALLVTPENGVLIHPKNEQYVIDELAKAMDRLAEDGDLAERMSAAGREIAIKRGFAWPQVVRDWTAVYRRVLGRRAGAKAGVARR